MKPTGKRIKHPDLPSETIDEVRNIVPEKYNVATPTCDRGQAGRSQCVSVRPDQHAAGGVTGAGGAELEFAPSDLLRRREGMGCPLFLRLGYSFRRSALSLRGEGPIEEGLDEGRCGGHAMRDRRRRRGLPSRTRSARRQPLPAA